MTERDRIGPNPIAWLRRLVDVNRGSKFTPEQKAIIEADLVALIERMERGS